ncbi:MAG: beta-ketoacyl synthase chain length factor [Betaproteobacteria bacterium]|nr:beta-ketoacyl synthase chain length factor [Betaproteobacteria bacterium]
MAHPASAPAGSGLVAWIAGVGLLGPGLPDWTAGAEILAGRQPYLPARTLVPVPASLPPAERRRVGAVVKLALAVGLEAAAGAAISPASLVTVFSSSTGDGHNCHQICETLASDDRHISPTRFHNSVHNAAAGYWSIATGATAPSNVLGAFDASFGAGLLEAMAQTMADRLPVLMLSYDSDYPEPLFATRPVPDTCGIALLMTPAATEKSLARLKVRLARPPADRLPDAGLEALRRAVPAARGLPLLALLAARRAGVAHLDYLDNVGLAAELLPC